MRMTQPAWLKVGMALALLTVSGAVACEDPVRAPATPPALVSASSEDEVAEKANGAASEEDGASSWSRRALGIEEAAFPRGTTLVIDGVAAPLTMLVTNGAVTPRSGVEWQAALSQPGAYREAGKGVLDCGSGAGIVPPGRCVVRGLPVTASNSASGSGTLVAGAATLNLELFRTSGGIPEVAARAAIGVTLSPSSGITGVVVTPSLVTLNGPGATVQLTGTVLPNTAPQQLLWTSSNAAVAVVTSTGFATATSLGGALITAASTADPTKLATSLISIGTQPVLGSGVNASPGSWNAVPGMSIRLAGQVVNGPPQVVWSSNAAFLATVSASGVVTAVSPGAVLITARSLFDLSKSADVAVEVFDFRWRFPITPTLVSTGAVSPPLNPTSVNLQVQACGPPTVLTPPFASATFEVQTGASWLQIGQAPLTLIIDIGGFTRCWVYGILWTPGTAFGTGVQQLRGSLQSLGGIGYSPVNSMVTLTTP